MSVPSDQAPSRLLRDFRQRADAYFGDPRAGEMVSELEPPSPPPAATAADALDASLGDALRRLGIPLGPKARLQLRKSLTMHDGRVVAMTGDTTPIGPDERVRVVSTTTAVVDQNRMRSETTILVLEQALPVVDQVIEQ
jgi:hypothetical protein